MLKESAKLVERVVGYKVQYVCQPAGDSLKFIPGRVCWLQAPSSKVVFDTQQ